MTMGRPGGRRTTERVGVDHAELEPHRPRPDRDRLVGELTGRVGAPEDVDDVDRERHVGERRVAALAEHLAVRRRRSAGGSGRSACRVAGAARRWSTPSGRCRRTGPRPPRCRGRRASGRPTRCAASRPCAEPRSPSRPALRRARCARPSCGSGSGSSRTAARRCGRCRGRPGRTRRRCTRRAGRRPSSRGPSPARLRSRPTSRRRGRRRDRGSGGPTCRRRPRRAGAGAGLDQELVGEPRGGGQVAGVDRLDHPPGDRHRLRDPAGVGGADGARAEHVAAPAEHVADRRAEGVVVRGRGHRPAAVEARAEPVGQQHGGRQQVRDVTVEQHLTSHTGACEAGQHDDCRTNGHQSRAPATRGPRPDRGARRGPARRVHDGLPARAPRRGVRRVPAVGGLVAAGFGLATIPSRLLGGRLCRRDRQQDHDRARPDGLRRRPALPGRGARPRGRRPPRRCCSGSASRSTSRRARRCSPR